MSAKFPGNERLAYPVPSFCYFVSLESCANSHALVHISFINNQSQVNTKKNRLEGETE